MQNLMVYSKWRTKSTFNFPRHVGLASSQKCQSWELKSGSNKNLLQSLESTTQKPLFRFFFFNSNTFANLKHNIFIL